MTPTRFTIRYGRWCGWLLGLIGIGRRFSGVEVTTTEVVVTMGWAFRWRFPRAAIVSVEHDHDRVWGWGVHGWRRVWLVNGSSHGLVRIVIDPAVRGRVVMVSCRIDTVRVSVEDPDGLIAALA